MLRLRLGSAIATTMGWRCEDSLRCDYEARANIAARITSAAAAGNPIVVAMWMVRDFGTRRNTRSVASVIKDIEEVDKLAIDNIFAKYGKSPNHEFQSEYPSWFVDFERNVVMKILQSIIYNITMANSIYPTDNFLND